MSKGEEFWYIKNMDYYLGEAGTMGMVNRADIWVQEKVCRLKK